MTDDQIKLLVKETAKETAQEVLRGLGADVDHPNEMQTDFVALREFRVVMHAARRKITVVSVGAIAAGLIAAAWVGIKYYINN